MLPKRTKPRPSSSRLVGVSVAARETRVAAGEKGPPESPGVAKIEAGGSCFYSNFPRPAEVAGTHPGLVPSNVQLLRNLAGQSQPVAITEEMSNGIEHFDFYHETKHGRGAGAKRLSDSFVGGPYRVRAGQAKTTPEKSLYERLGGVFAIAAVVDHFSDAVVKNPIVGQKVQEPAAAGMAYQEFRKAARPQVHATLWVCDVSGGPVPVYGHSSPARRGRPLRRPTETCGFPERI